MPAPRKPKGKKSVQAPSLLDSEKRILQERQRQIDEKIAALNRTIKEAAVPGYRMDAATARTGAVPAGKRYGETTRRVPKKVVLRAERQEGRLQTFALLMVVIALLVWMVYRYV